MRMPRIEVVDDDKIEVRTRGHLSRPKAAESKHRALSTAHTAMRRGEIGFHPSIHLTEQNVGEPGECLARLLGRQRSGNDARTDEEHMFLAKQPNGIKHRFEAVNLLKRPLKVRPQAWFVGQRTEEARIDQRIDKMRMMRQDIGEPWRRANDERDEADQFRILPQQREKAATRVQPG